MSRRQRKRLPDTPAELVIDRLSDEGRGIGALEGKVVFVEGALPGERVRFAYTHVSGKHDEGRVIEVLEASPERVTPPCVHAEICGGCSLQHMAPSSQIALKQQVLEGHFRRNGGLSPAQWLPPLTGPSEGYRRRARLGAKYVLKKEQVMVGFREKRSHFLADMNQCLTLVPEVGQKISALKEMLSGLVARDRIPQISVAQGDDATALVVRHLDPLAPADEAILVQFCQQEGFQLYLQPKGEDTVHRIWPAQGEERLHYRLPAFDVELAFHPNDFTQVNPYINERMIDLALQWLDPQPQDRVLDLFCGLGNFTLPIARRAGHVVGVEGAEAMVARGKENASRNGLTNVEFHGADLTQALLGKSWANEGFNKLLIDPPRSGALEIVSHMTLFKPERIVYVSCDPATLARDAAELVKRGYRMKVAGVMDMFPHTTHVESIAVFEPGK